MVNFSATDYCLSGNALKIIGAVTMLIDHIGMMLLPSVTILRIIGRIAFPIYSFMLAEGCYYTKNKLRYFLNVFVLGVGCQVVLYLQRGNTKMGILITFSLSILAVYALQHLKNSLFAPERGLIKRCFAVCIFLLVVLGIYFLNEAVRIDYGFFGCMAPAFASLLRKPKSVTSPFWEKLDNNALHLLLFGICLVIIACTFGRIQPYCLLALPFLMLYSGKRGSFKMKYFFYIFYPAHLVILEGVSYFLT